MDERTIAKALDGLDPSASAAVVTALLRKQQELLEKKYAPRPKRHFYYRPDVAEMVRPSVDKMIETKDNMEFIFEHFPTISKDTVRLKVENGVLYLVDNDTDGKYKTWRRMVKFSCKQPDRVGYYWIHDVNELGKIQIDTLNPVFVKDTIDPRAEQVQSFTVLQHISGFIQSAKKGEHEKFKFAKLSATDIQAVKSFMEPFMDEYELLITPNSISIHKGKLNEETND